MFTEQKISYFSFITMICKQLQKKDAQKTFPEFILLLRDVAHVKLRNEKVQPTEYLKDVLQPSEDENDRYSAKWCIREYCQRIACFKLTQPVEFEDLSELGEMNNPKLKERFLEDFKILKDHLFCDCDIKRLTNDAPCTTNGWFLVPLQGKILRQHFINLKYTCTYFWRDSSNIRGEKNVSATLNIRMKFKPFLVVYSPCYIQKC